VPLVALPLGDQMTLEAVPGPQHGLHRTVGIPLVLLEPLVPQLVWSVTVGCLQAVPKSSQGAVVPCRRDGRRQPVTIFHPDGAANPLCTNGTPCCALLAVQWSLCYLFGWFGAPEAVIWAANLSVQMKMCLIGVFEIPEKSLPFP